MITLPNFEDYSPFGQPFLVGRLPSKLFEFATTHFENLWDLHPAKSHEILIHGSTVSIPRWQQAYGRDYHFSGTVNEALPVSKIHSPFLEWVRNAIDTRLNGLLLNWYAAEKGHYIGAHRDSRKGLIQGTPIVTISIGDERSFRLRPFKAKGFVNFKADHGAVFVTPWDTNLGVKHEVPHSAHSQGRRISITARAFAGDGMRRDAAKTREQNQEVR